MSCSPSSKSSPNRFPEPCPMLPSAQCSRSRGGSRPLARGQKRSKRLGLSTRGHISMRASPRCRVKVSPRRLRISRKASFATRSEEHTSELQSHSDLVCRLLLEKKKKKKKETHK